MKKPVKPIEPLKVFRETKELARLYSSDGSVCVSTLPPTAKIRFDYDGRSRYECYVLIYEDVTRANPKYMEEQLAYLAAHEKYSKDMEAYKAYMSIPVAERKAMKAKEVAERKVARLKQQIARLEGK